MNNAKPFNNKQVASLPLPTLLLLQQAVDHNGTTPEIVKTIELDPVLTTLVLEVANSPIYRSRTPIKTIEKAVSWLGKSEVVVIALSLAFNNIAKTNAALREQIIQHWRRSFIQGVIMNRLGELCIEIDRNEACVTGLMMDLGSLIFFDRYGESYGQLYQRAQYSRRPLDLLEYETLGKSHAAIGAEFLTAMGLPSVFADVARLHTCSIKELAAWIHPENPERGHLISAAVAASHLADFFCLQSQGESLMAAEEIISNALHRSTRDLDWLLRTVRLDVEEKASLFTIEIADLPKNEMLLGRAAEFVERGGWTPFLENDLQCSERMQRFTRAEQAIKGLENQLCRDKLTRLFNFDYFMGRLDASISMSRMMGTSVSVLVFNIDSFRQINLKHGAVVGDQALHMVARVLRELTGSHTTLARANGNTLVGLFTKHNFEELIELGESICKEVVDRAPERNHLGIPLTISVGGVIANPVGDDDSAITLIDWASQVLYESKKWGGNQSTIRTRKDWITNRRSIPDLFQSEPSSIPLGIPNSLPGTLQ